MTELWQRSATDLQRLLAGGQVSAREVLEAHVARIHEVNPADLTRQITRIQTQLTGAAQTKTETLAAAKPLDMESLQPSINRLTPT